MIEKNSKTSVIQSPPPSLYLCSMFIVQLQQPRDSNMRIEHWLEINECFYAMNRLTIFMHISMVGILELNFLYSLPFVEHGTGCLGQGW